MIAVIGDILKRRSTIFRGAIHCAIPVKIVCQISGLSPSCDAAVILYESCSVVGSDAVKLLLIFFGVCGAVESGGHL